MPLTGGLAHSAPFGTAVAICLLPTAVAAFTLFRAIRFRPPAARVGLTLRAAGLTTAAVTLVVAAAVRLATDRSDVDPAGHGVAVTITGLGLGLAVLLLGAGLLWAPMVVAPRSRFPQVLDGTLVMICLLAFAWAGFLEPWHDRLVDGRMPIRLIADCLVLSIPVILAGTVIGTSVVTASNRPRLPGPALVVCAGTGLFSAGLLGLMIGSTGRAAPWVLQGSTLTVSAGAVALMAAVHMPGRQAVPPARETRPCWLSLSVVVLAMLTLTGRVIMAGEAGPDPVSVVLALIIGTLLTAQQVLARRAITSIAERLAESEAHFRSIAHTDALTDLANRRELFRILEEDVRGGPACVLLSIDLDGFKNINDIRGHDVGDAVLVEVARRLRSNVRPGDCPARLGGDEFAVLMWAKPTEAMSMATRMLTVLNQPYELDSGTVFVTASIGMAGCLEADSIDSLMRNADLALRFAKQSGKNRVEAYDVAYDDLVRRRTELEHELRGAVDRGELMLVYQPVVEVRTGVVAGVEALLRWHHPRLGMVSPAEFIPLAEEVGLIHGLGRFVVHEAARQLSHWIADGHDLWMSVNASVRELHTPEYADLIREVLRVHRVPAGKLTIEVTEHAAARDVQQLKQRLTDLRAIGVRVALDDFGSEYSSLKLLRTLPVDALKIDRELLENDCLAPDHGTDTCEESRHAPIVDVVVTIGQRLGLDVVAEGVSEPQQRALLIGYGCRYAQGTLFGDGMPAERVETLFRNVGEVDSAREIRHG